MIQVPRPQVMFMRRPPLPLLAMALALSAVALVRADDLVLSRFSEYLDALRLHYGLIEGAHSGIGRAARSFVAEPVEGRAKDGNEPRGG